MLVASQAEAQGRTTYVAVKRNRGTSTNIPESVIRDYCGDIDGCKIRIGMYNWDGARRVASRETLFYYDSATGVWRDSEGDTQGTTNNARTEHIIQAWACYFTDGEYRNWQDFGDPTRAFALLSWNNKGYNADCRVTIID